MGLGDVLECVRSHLHCLCNVVDVTIELVHCRIFRHQSRDFPCPRCIASIILQSLDPTLQTSLDSRRGKKGLSAQRSF